MAGSSSQNHGRDVVPYQPTQPSTPRETRSQRQLLSEPLHAGNLKAYLDGISLVDVQSVLSRHFLQNQRDRSIFSYLVEPGNGILPHEAASAVLQELASKTESVAILATLAYRLIEAKGLWKGHPDPSVKSAEDLIRKLDAGSDVAQANIGIGAFALRQRQSYVRLIEEAWRPGWFDDIPQSIRPPAWTRPEDLPRDVLVQITANAKQGIPVATAITRWTEHIARRTDHGRRRREGIRGPTVPHLILSDIKRLNLPVEDADYGKRTSDVFFPKDAPLDRLEIKLGTPKSSARPDYSKAGQTASVKKRKRGPVESAQAAGSEDEVRDENEWQWRDGMMAKRVKNQLITRPPTSEELVLMDAPPTQLVEGTVSQHDSSPSDRTSLPATRLSCDGPGIALIFGKFVDMYQELRSLDADTAKLTASCCDSCRVFVLRALASLEADLVPCVRGLEQVEQHTFDGHDVRPSQNHGISPRKQAPPSGRKVGPRPRIIPDSSDTSEVD
jgi:hypothetical protein